MGAGRDSARWQRIAVSGQPIAVSASGCQLPVPGGCLPANWYLQADESLSACTEILRCAQDDCGRREGGCLKSDVWCLNVSLLSGIPLSGQRIAVSGQLSCYPAGNPVTLSLFIAAGDTTTLGPKGRSPLLHNPPPSGGHNPRGQRPRPPSSSEPSEPLRPEGASLSHWHRTSFRDILSLITFGIRKLLDFDRLS